MKKQLVFGIKIIAICCLTLLFIQPIVKASSSTNTTTAFTSSLENDLYSGKFLVIHSLEQPHPRTSIPICETITSACFAGEGVACGANHHSWLLSHTKYYLQAIYPFHTYW